jgi:hypothetical protein
MNLSQLPDQPLGQPAPDLGQHEGIVDPFMPLIQGGIDLRVPDEHPDAFVWVAYTAGGDFYSEAAADPRKRRWPTLEIADVTFIDLLPVALRCDEHPEADPDCVKCVLAYRRRALRPVRLQVPLGGAAHFERRRDRDFQTNRLVQNWTILGWERNFLNVRPLGLKLADSGPRDVQVAFYVFIDDLGRSFLTSDLQAL